MRKASFSRLLHALVIATLALTLSGALTVFAQDVPPPLPHAFYGAVTINGQPAPIGTRIEVRGAGVLTGIENNPLVTTTAGHYGARSLGPKLVVQGNIEEEAALTFYINGLRAEVQAPGGAWQQSFPFTSGIVTELNLRATIYTRYLPGIQR